MKKIKFENKLNVKKERITILSKKQNETIIGGAKSMLICTGFTKCIYITQ